MCFSAASADFLGDLGGQKLFTAEGAETGRGARGENRCGQLLTLLQRILRIA